MIAFSAKDLGKIGMTDEEQMETAIHHKAAIFTHDVDFLRIAHKRNHLGIIYVRQSKLSIVNALRNLKY